MKFKRIVLLLSFSLRDYRSWNDIEKEKKKNIYIYISSSLKFRNRFSSDYRYLLKYLLLALFTILYLV